MKSKKKKNIYWATPIEDGNGKYVYMNKGTLMFYIFVMMVLFPSLIYFYKDFIFLFFPVFIFMFIVALIRSRDKKYLKNKK